MLVTDGDTLQLLAENLDIVDLSRGFSISNDLELLRVVVGGATVTGRVVAAW